MKARRFFRAEILGARLDVVPLKRRLRIRHIPARDASVSLLRKLWAIRLSYFPLGPGRTEQEDWFEFSGYFQRDRRELIVFCDGDEPVGFFVNSHDLVEHDGRRAVLVSIEYTYMQSEFRGHPAFVLAGFRMFFRLLARFPFVPIYYVGFVFPNSFAFVGASFGRTFTLQEDPPPFEAHLLRWYGREAGGAKWDDERGLARYGNVPPDTVARESKPARVREQYDRYDRINPSWRDGNALVVLAPADSKAFGSVVRRMLRRASRELRRAA